MNEALHITFAIKPSLSESDHVIFEEALRRTIPQPEIAHISSSDMKPTPDLYPSRRNFDSNVGVYIKYSSKCEKCSEFYNNIETRLDVFSIEEFMNDEKTQRVQDILFLGVDGFSGEISPTLMHTSVRNTDESSSYILYAINDDHHMHGNDALGQVLFFIFFIFFFFVLILSLWNVPVVNFERQKEENKYCSCSCFA